MDTRIESCRGCPPTLLLLAATLATVAGACQPADDPLEPEPPGIPVSLVLPAQPYDYEGVVLPKHFRTNGFPSRFSHQRAAIDLDNMPADNPVTNDGATLGRVLFYDRSLSSNGDVACATCHDVDRSFTDGLRFSVGVGGSTRRTAMSLLNVRFYRPDRFFRDERAPSLEEQALMPIQDPLEMGLTLDQLVSIVESRPYYPQLFKNAFGDEVVTPHRIARRLHSSSAVSSPQMPPTTMDERRSKVPSTRSRTTRTSRTWGSHCSWIRAPAPSPVRTAT